MSIGFIILRHVNSRATDRYWRHSYDCVRKFYPENEIVIIDDNSKQQFITEKKLYKARIIKSEFPGRGELLPYYYYSKEKFFDTAVIIHDSVFIHKYIDFSKFNDSIYYLWHFGHESNDLNNEKQMIKLLKNEKIEKIEECYDAQKWNGCFGVQTIIKYEFIERLEKEFNIFKLLENIDNRQKRMNFERIFSVLCTLLNEDLFNQKSIYGNIKKYIKWEYTFEEYLNQIENLDLDLIKTWNGR